MEEVNPTNDQSKRSTDACKAIVKQRGWRWEKEMRILTGERLDLNDGKIKSCDPCKVDDVILRQPFSDKYMQCIRQPVPDLEDDRTVERCLVILRELWQHEGVRLIVSGDGYAIITRTGQFWAPTRGESLLMGFENISWGDRDNGKWR